LLSKKKKKKTGAVAEGRGQATWSPGGVALVSPFPNKTAQDPLQLQIQRGKYSSTQYVVLAESYEF
jgi:hypothetical protein